MEGAWDSQRGGLPVALDRAVEGGWSRVIYTYSLTTLSEIQTMTYTDQGQVESDPHLVTSSPPKYLYQHGIGVAKADAG